MYRFFDHIHDVPAGHQNSQNIKNFKVFWTSRQSNRLYYTETAGGSTPSRGKGYNFFSKALIVSIYEYDKAIIVSIYEFEQKETKHKRVSNRVLTFSHFYGTLTYSVCVLIFL